MMENNKKTFLQTIYIYLYTSAFLYLTYKLSYERLHNTHFFDSAFSLCINYKDTLLMYNLTHSMTQHST